MKDKILNLLKSKIFFAVVINIIIMFIYIAVTSFSFDRSNDFYNSLLICHRHFYYNNTINYIFAIIVGSMQYILSNFNCFVLALILMSCASFISVTYVLFDKFGRYKALVLTLIINFLFAVSHYANINSNKTSALLFTGGFLLVLNAIRNKRYNLPFWVGIVEILFGTCLCFEYFFVGIAFSIMFFLGDMIVKKKYKLPFRKFFWYFRPFVLVFLLVLLVGLGAEYYSYTVNNSSSDLADYYKYTELSDTVDSYPFPEYSKYKDDLKAVGIKNTNEYELLINGYYDKDNLLDNNALEMVAKIQKKEHPYNVVNDISNIGSEIWTHIVSMDSFTVIYIVLLIIIVLFITLQKKRFAVFPVFYILIAFASSLFMRFMLVKAANNMYGVFLMMFMFMIYSFSIDNFISKDRAIIKLIKNKYLAIVALLIICSSSFFAFYSHIVPVDYKNKPSNLYAEVNRHPERYYVIDPATAKKILKYTNNYTHPLWGFKKSFMCNVDGFGFLHQNGQLLNRNLPTNIYQVVLNKNVYVIDKGITFKKERYINTYYIKDDNDIYYKEVKEINGYKIYSVVAE